MKVIVNIERMTVEPYRGTNSYLTIADAMESKIGETEYNGYVRRIQTWYYGRPVEAAWCATGLSWFADIVGVGAQTGKHENVDRMKEFMGKRIVLNDNFYTRDGYYGLFNAFADPSRGDVVFMSSKHTFEDCTHVGVVSAIDRTVGTLCVCSCNINSAGRKDGIYLNCYNYKTDPYIVGFGIIEY